MSRIACVAAFLWIAPTVVMAEDFEAVSKHFRTILRVVGNSPGGTAEWLDMVPKIRDDCGFKVNRANVDNWLARTNDPQGALTIARIFQTGVQHSELSGDWEKFVAFSKDGACNMANGLWGEDGDMVPGIFEAR